MNILLQNLKNEINEWFDNLSKEDIEDVEYGKPFHIMAEDKGRIMRAVLFLERHDW